MTPPAWDYRGQGRDQLIHRAMFILACPRLSGFHHQTSARSSAPMTEAAHVCANSPTPPSGSDLIRMLLLRNPCIALHGYQLHEKRNTVKPCSHGLTTLSEKFWSGTDLTVCHKYLQESLIIRGSLSDVSVCVCSLYMPLIFRLHHTPRLCKRARHERDTAKRQKKTGTGKKNKRIFLYFN